jgi:hypothetical protein
MQTIEKIFDLLGRYYEDLRKLQNETLVVGLSSQIFGGLKPNYKQKQCDNIVSPDIMRTYANCKMRRW